MKNAIVGTVIVVGMLLMGEATGRATHDPRADAAFYFGSVMPGLAVLLIGLILRRRQPEPRIKLWPLLTIGSILTFLAFTTRFLGPLLVFQPDTGEPWRYKSEDHSFSMTLPSKNWKHIIEEEKADVAFRNSRAFIGVNAYPNTDSRAFEEQVKNFDHAFAKLVKNRIGDIVVEQGETDSGQPLISWTTTAMNGNRRTYLSAAWIFCPDKKLAVSVVLEGACKMLLDSEKEAEMDYFDKTARSIRQSIE